MIKLFLSTFLLTVLGLAPLSLMAENTHVKDALAETQTEIPLKQALGEEAYNQAMESGDYRYVGNSKCRLCHRSFFVGRKNDLHDFTMKKLVKSKNDKNDKCLVCHSTGHGVNTGYVDMEVTPRLSNVQCEGCHGPGNVHIKLAKINAKTKSKEKARGLLAGSDNPKHLTKMCTSCHTDRWNKSYHNLKEAYDDYSFADPKKKKK